jgi:hypothetical protein
MGAQDTPSSIRKGKPVRSLPALQRTCERRGRREQDQLSAGAGTPMADRLAPATRAQRQRGALSRSGERSTVAQCRPSTYPRDLRCVLEGALLRLALAGLELLPARRAPMWTRPAARGTGGKRTA